MRRRKISAVEAFFLAVAGKLKKNEEGPINIFFFLFLFSVVMIDVASIIYAQAGILILKVLFFWGLAQLHSSIIIIIDFVFLFPLLLHLLRRCCCCLSKDDDEDDEQ